MKYRKTIQREFSFIHDMELISGFYGGHKFEFFVCEIFSCFVNTILVRETIKVKKRPAVW